MAVNKIEPQEWEALPQTSLVPLPPNAGHATKEGGKQELEKMNGPEFKS